MRSSIFLLSIILTGCSSVSSTQTAFCNSSSGVNIIYKEPSQPYKTCGNIEVKGHAVNNRDKLNQYLISEARKLGAETVILMNKEDSFNWSDGRVISADAIAIQYTE